MTFNPKGMANKIWPSNIYTWNIHYIFIVIKDELNDKSKLKHHYYHVDMGESTNVGPLFEFSQNCQVWVFSFVIFKELAEFSYLDKSIWRTGWV